MFIETAIEKRLIEYGYDLFTVREKNNLVETLANREQLTYSDITSEYILNHHKTLKAKILSDTCEEEIIKGFTATNGHFYRTNRDDQINIIGQKDELSADESIKTVYWKTEDAGYIAHTKEEWLKISVEAFEHKKQKLFKYNNLKLLVVNAKTHSEIVAIDWYNAGENPDIKPIPVIVPPVVEPEPEPIVVPPVVEPVVPPVVEPEPIIETTLEPVVEIPEPIIETTLEPVVEIPETEVPVTEEPAVDPEPVVETPVTEEPITEEPAVEEPVTEG